MELQQHIFGTVSDFLSPLFLFFCTCYPLLSPVANIHTYIVYVCIFSLFAFATRALYLLCLIFFVVRFFFCFFFAFCLLSAKQTTWLRFVVLLAVVIVVLAASPMMAVSVPNKRALTHTHVGTLVPFYE